MPLRGKKGSIAGIANEHSIAYGCAKVLRGAGAELGVTYVPSFALAGIGHGEKNSLRAYLVCIAPITEFLRDLRQV